MYRTLVAGACLAVLVAGTPVPGNAGQTQRVEPQVLEEQRKVEMAAAVRARVAVEAAVVKGAPYFADVVIERTQQLADGNRIVNRTTGRVYRDSEGRTRREEDREPGRAGTISISDPVAQVSIVLDPEAKAAWRTAGSVARTIGGRGGRGGSIPRTTDPAELERLRRLEAEIAAGTARVVGPRPLPPPPPPAPAAGAGVVLRERKPIWEEKTETLPARQIEGVIAEGTRTTRTIPAGAIGNEQPIVITSEEWVSPELQVLVMTRSADPRTGESTYRLLNITRGEPNASWFEIPADYTVRESGVRRPAGLSSER